MLLLQGAGISKGIAKGPIYFLYGRENTVERRSIDDTEAERQRFYKAQQVSIRQLEALAECCRKDTDEEAADLFEAHAMLAADDDYRECIMNIMKDEKCNAEYAVQQASERFAALFEALDDAYMQARTADIRDVSRRMIDNLMGANEGGVKLEKPVILAADDLAPSETVRLDRKMILGIITRRGSENSHTAILARTMGIPAVCSLGGSLREVYDGKTAYMDGETGRVIIEPDESTDAAMQEKYVRQQAARDAMEAMKGQEDITLDGRRIDVCCNIGAPEDVAAVLENDGRGIGLFRSEFLYLSAEDYPGEEEQFLAYKSVAAAMKGRRVIIRTLDIGADKQVDYFNMKKEENPALGMRAVRLCLNRPEIFMTQLRALYRASAFGKVAIMFPMITSLWEVRECRRICRMVAEKLEAEGIPYDRNMEIGIMIETPASVFIADELAREVDFFSVGTNDLAQYILACDRQSGDLNKFYNPHHPAVLRALKMVAEAARRAGIWIGICGEMGADPALLPLFLSLGIDELSVAPGSVLPLRAEIRRSAAKNDALEKMKADGLL